MLNLDRETQNKLHNHGFRVLRKVVILLLVTFPVFMCLGPLPRIDKKFVALSPWPLGHDTLVLNRFHENYNRYRRCLYNDSFLR